MQTLIQNNVVTKAFPGGIKVHGFQTGTVAVKREHYKYSGLGILRVPRILFGWRWAPPMPIWVWAIETPHGNYLIDTGESTAFYDNAHFGTKPDRIINRKILNIEVTREQEIDRQLHTVGLSAEKIDVVIMTHMHIDHTDGIRHFPKAEFFVSRKDWEKPIGVPLSTFPKWFKGSEIDHAQTSLPFEGAYQFCKEISLVSTPGHSLGHQSVLLDLGDRSILFTGDAVFSETQLKKNEVGGINLLIKKSKETQERIRRFCSEGDVVVLPSHDPESGMRLRNDTYYR